MVKRAVFLREKQNTFNLWKTRPDYHALRGEAAEKAGAATFTIEKLDAYCHQVSRRMRIRVLGFKPPFAPISKKRVMLYSEEKKLVGKEIRDVSRLVASLKVLWENDPQEFYLLVGKNVRSRRGQLSNRWVEETADWIRNPRLL